MFHIFRFYWFLFFNCLGSSINLLDRLKTLINYVVRLSLDFLFPPNLSYFVFQTNLPVYKSYMVLNSYM